jgi:hypothetical protein
VCCFDVQVLYFNWHVSVHICSPCVSAMWPRVVSLAEMHVRCYVGCHKALANIVCKSACVWLGVLMCGLCGILLLLAVCAK